MMKNKLYGRLIATTNDMILFKFLEEIKNTKETSLREQMQVKLHNIVRKQLNTDNLICFGVDVESEEISVYEFNKKADGEVHSLPKFDEEGRVYLEE